ncbi:MULTISPECIES: AI-2E family transporter [Halomonadaceae]|uniref:AI-2E family transporter n=1 Tax=Halomonadaceae TaxID=28256 RepID=UPI0015991C39|nr:MULTISPECIES: AI-2E family transporter [Halomonas]QJQ96178.1 AI-2E family transporter [Halomonas sp. PA5]
MEDGFGNTARFAKRSLIVISLAALVAVLIYFAGQLIDVLLLVFAGILVAVAIDGMARLISRYLPLTRKWTLSLAFFLIVLFIVGLGALIGPQVAEQLPQLVQQLPAAIEQFASVLQQLPGGEQALDEIEEMEEPTQFINQEMIGQFTGMFSTTFGAITSFFLILLIGIYLVISPAMYAGNVVSLFPKAHRERIQEVLAMEGRSLRLWLLSRLISMVFVGVGVSIGLTFLGVPMPIALGVIGGLLTFIPYLGPILGMIPTALIALMEGPELALYAILFYFVIETVEANVVMPLAAKGVVHLPPAYTVIVQLAGGAVAGLAGVILAAPIAVVVVVAVQMLYIEDVLGDDVHVLGE